MSNPVRPARLFLDCRLPYTVLYERLNCDDGRLLFEWHLDLSHDDCLRARTLALMPEHEAEQTKRLCYRAAEFERSYKATNAIVI